MNEYHEWKKFAFNFKSLFDLSKKKNSFKSFGLTKGLYNKSAGTVLIKIFEGGNRKGGKMP